jgi:TolB protein
MPLWKGSTMPQRMLNPHSFFCATIIALFALATSPVQAVQQRGGRGQIAYMTYKPDTQTYTLVVQNLDTTATYGGSFRLNPTTILTNDISSKVTPAWSPNGQYVVYTTLSGGSEDIFLADSLTGLRRQLTSDPATDTSPVWSPNGKQIAFVSDRGKDKGLTEIYVMDISGANVVRITRSGPRGIASDPCWSADGRSVMYVFKSAPDAQPEVHIASADGQKEQLLLPAKNYVGPVIWSPDGKQLAFFAAHDGNNRTDLIVGDSDGNNLRTVTTNREIASPDSAINPAIASPNYHLAWSADSQHVAFENTNDGNYEIYVVDTNTLKSVNVSNDGGDDRMPGWSPDGRTVIFMSKRDYQYDLYTVNPDGSQLTNITKSAGNEAMPIWSVPVRTDF